MRWAAGVVVAGLLAGCGDDGLPDHVAACAAADYYLPGDTLEDLVTWADQVAVVTVLDETEVDGRRITMRIDEVVWDGPRDAPVPAEITFATEGGWVDDDPEKGPRAGCDQPVLEVGERYLAGVVQFSDDEWGLMNGPFTLEVDDDGEVHGVVDGGPLEPYDGQPAQAVGDALADVEPDPGVAGYEDLPAIDRMLAASGSDVEGTTSTTAGG